MKAVKYHRVDVAVGNSGEYTTISGPIYKVDGMNVVVGVSPAHGWSFLGVDVATGDIVSCQYSYYKCVEAISRQVVTVVPLTHRPLQQGEER